MLILLLKNNQTKTQILSSIYKIGIQLLNWILLVGFLSSHLTFGLSECVYILEIIFVVI